MRNAPKVKKLLIFLKYIYEFISKTARLALKRCLPAACLRKMLSFYNIFPFILCVCWIGAVFDTDSQLSSFVFSYLIFLGFFPLISFVSRGFALLEFLQI